MIIITPIQLDRANGGVGERLSEFGNRRDGQRNLYLA